MRCDYKGCGGYVFLHEEGASCDFCHRLQQPVFSSKTEKKKEDEEVLKPNTFSEVCLLPKSEFLQKQMLIFHPPNHLKGQMDPL